MDDDEGRDLKIARTIFGSMLIALLLCIGGILLAEDYVTVESVESSPYICTVDGVAQESIHVDTHKASERVANLALSNPDSEVLCRREEVLLGTLTAAGRALVVQDEPEEPPVDPPEEPPEEPDPPEEPPPAGWPAEVPAPFAWSELPACPEPVIDGDWIVLSASNCISTGIQATGRTLSISGENLVVRDFEVDGQGQTNKVGVRISGQNIVVMNGAAHHLLGTDRHAFTVSGGSRDIWLIENEAYYCAGDGFQAGHGNETNRPTNIYLVRNHFHECRENGIDTKYLTNVIAVENEIWGMRSAPSDTSYCLPDMPDRCSMQNSGSDGTGIIIGADGAPIGWGLYRNVIHDSDGCIRVEEGVDPATIAGNTCTDIDGAGLQLDKSSGHITFSGNTIERAGRGIFQGWRENFSLTVDGNTFRDIPGPSVEYEASEVFNSSTLTGNTFSASGPVIYGSQSAETAEQINSLPGASENQVN